jgi:glycosyltransferase involved in cell wall biosynthesis
MKVLLVGPQPPPFGGVSVYLKRLKRQLENEGHRVDIHDPTKQHLISYYLTLFLLPFKRYDLISINVQSIHLLLIVFMLGLASRAQVIDHNWRVLENWPTYKIRLYSFMLNRFQELVLVGPHLRIYYETHGVRLPLTTRMLSPFLPPLLDEEEAILKTYSPETHEFVATHSPLLIANAPRVVFYKGLDLYGLDMCVELVAGLKQEFRDVGLLFAIGEMDDDAYYRQIQSRIAELGIAGNVYFLTRQKEMWPLLKKADLMVRPTCTDAYGISVAEALYLGCAAVASDVCERANGTILFVNRNKDDFLLKCRQVLERPGTKKQKAIWGE